LVKWQLVQLQLVLGQPVKKSYPIVTYPKVSIQWDNPIGNSKFSLPWPQGLAKPVAPADLSGETKWSRVFRAATMVKQQ
jgi:hypothetical protein